MRSSPIFFLLVGLEIKREFTVGRLAQARSAAFPVAAAIGGMAVPAALYSLVVPSGQWSHGWGVPMATDTAFAVALIVMLGKRVPVELRIFLTAASIVDDIGAIIVVALFYSGALHWDYLAGAAAITVLLALLNRWGVYRALPYAFLGIALWACIHAGGLHSTLAGVVLALFIPTRPPPNLKALMAQATAVLTAETARGPDVLRHGPSTPALRALDAIHDRLESPADRTLRAIEPWSSYLVLPLFALANAGVALSTGMFAGREMLVSAIALGLVVGKPAGFMIVPALAVWAGVAIKPAAYSWRQLLGAGALAGIGFTMSLFIAGQAFASPDDFSAAKIAVFLASIVSAVAGVALLWRPLRAEASEDEATGESAAAYGHSELDHPFGVGRGFSLTRRVAAGCSRSPQGSHVAGQALVDSRYWPPRNESRIASPLTVTEMSLVPASVATGADWATASASRHAHHRLRPHGVGRLDRHVAGPPRRHAEALRRVLRARLPCLDRLLRQCVLGGASRGNADGEAHPR